MRPTSDKVRQAVFNILEHKDFGVAFAFKAREWTCSPGPKPWELEGAITGARYCLFVDDAAASLALIRDNVEGVLADRRNQDMAARCGRLRPARYARRRFDLAFLDPPYRKGLIALPRWPGCGTPGAWLRHQMRSSSPNWRKKKLFRLQGI